MNNLKTALLVLLFPLILLATLWGAVASVALMVCAGLLISDAHIVFAWPVQWADVLPQFSWHTLNITPPDMMRGWYVLPAPLFTLWHDYAPAALGASIAALPYMTAVAAVMLLLALRFESHMTAALAGVRRPAAKECPALATLLHRLCIAHQMPTPRLYVSHSLYPNAYASGVGAESYAITVSAGLLGMLDEDEVRAVLAHELSHIRHGDVRLLVVVNVVAGLVTGSTIILWRMVTHSLLALPTRYNRLAFSIPFVAILATAMSFGALAAELVKRIMLRERETLADRGSAQLTGNAAAMASALARLATSQAPAGIPVFMQDAFIYRPIKGWRRWLSSHPTLPQRQTALAALGGQHRHGVPFVRLVVE